MPIDHNDHEAIRRYLLGHLPEAETDGLEERLLADPELFELACAVEAELVEAGARGEIPPLERAQLRQRLAASPAGRERLAFHSALAAALAKGSAKPLPAPLSFAGRVRRRVAAAPARYAAAAALAASIAAAFLWPDGPGRQRHPGESAQQGTPVASEPARPAEARPIGTGGGAGEPAPVPTEQRRADATLPKGREQAPEQRPPLAPLVIEIAFTPQTRSAGPAEETRRFKLKDPNQPIKIRVDFEWVEEFPKFEAVITTGEQDVWRKADLAAEEGGKTLVLRPGVLAPGHYWLQVDGIAEDGTSEPLGESEFEVVVQ